jgi:hypothetical protein
MPIRREIDERERPPHARTRPASGRQRPRLLGRRARHRAASLRAADAGDPRRRQPGDRSGLRRRAARGLSGAAAMDGVLALRRHPSPARRRPGRALPGPGRRPRSGARRQQPARRCTPSSSRPWARSRARASSMSAPAPATIARSWPSWSTPPARSRRSSSTRRWPSGPRPFPAVRTFGSSMATAPAGREPRPTASMSFSSWRGRRIAGSRTSHATAGWCSRLASRDRSGRIPAAGTATATRRGAQDRTARRGLRGARNQHCLFCLRRRRIRG